MPEATSLERAPNSIYTTTSIWERECDHVLVVDCSDPRLSEARAEFLEKGCAARRHDSLIVLGGPATIILSAHSYFTECERIKLLHGFHGFNRVIGIAHHDCGYYKEKYPSKSAAERLKLQVGDLKRFKGEMERLVPGAEIELFFAEPAADGRTQYRKIF